MPDTITITRAQLFEALRAWEQDARDGKCIGHDETRAKSVDDVAEQSTERLWAALGGEEIGAV